MNSRILPRPRTSGLVLLLCGVLFGTGGCVSKADRVDWDARLDQFTYDQAVLEMGPPDKEAKLSDGTVVAQWLTRRGRSFQTHHVLYGGWISTSDSTPGPDQYLTLTFTPGGVLSGHNIVYK